MTSSNVIYLPQLQDFRYTLLPGRVPHDFKAVNLHNQVFKFWAEFWQENLQELAGHKLSAEDFYRQNIIAVLHQGQQLVALQMYSFFNIESLAALSVPYFGNYPKADLERLRARYIHSVMTMEYFTILPAYRKTANKFSYGALLSGLGYEVLRASGYQAMIGCCRADRKVDALARQFGGETLTPAFEMHGVPVVNMVTPVKQLRPYPEEQTARLIERLWKARIDLSGFPLPREQRAQIFNERKTA